jgi:hypothetical protein
MFPATRDGVGDAITPLNELVGDYGDVMEAFVAYEFALQSGMDTGKVAAELQREFAVAQAAKDQFVNTHALDTVAIRLNEIRDAHGH